MRPTDDPDFSDSFCDFLQRCVVNVDTVELLLRLSVDEHSAPTTTELTAALARTATVTDGDVRRLLDRLVGCGLVERRADDRWSYRPPPRDRDHVVMLSRLYVERPVTLFRVIYALRDSHIKTFADAFQLRR